MEMYAVGVYDLGLTTAQFFGLTYSQFWALCKRQVAAEERQDRRVASLMAFYAEVHRDRDKRSEPFTVDDFLGKPQRIRVVETHPDETPEETMQRMIGPQPDPELVIARIKANARGFGKWSVENG